MSFGTGGDVFATEIELLPQSANFQLHTPQGSSFVRLPFAGEHNVQNATAAVAFALALGVSLDDIVKGLEQAQGAKGRLNFIQKRLIYLLMILITLIQHLCELRHKYYFNKMALKSW